MKLNKEYVIQDLCGMKIALSPATNDMIKLSDTGALIFGMLGTDTSEDEIFRAMCAKYPDVARNTLSADLTTFINQLRKANLLNE